MAGFARDARRKGEGEEEQLLAQIEQVNRSHTIKVTGRICIVEMMLGEYRISIYIYIYIYIQQKYA